MKSISNPFVGLRSFENSESHLFFGRDKQIKDVISNLENTGFTAIIGSSGSGKSSLIRSGLIHAIKKGAIKGQGEGWKVGIFKPGYDPIGNLSECLSSKEIIGDANKTNISSLKEHTLNILRTKVTGISEVLNDFTKENSENILLIIDQFEEIFRVVDNEKDYPIGNRDSSLFVNLILNTLSNKRVYIALSMRSDFLGDCTQFFGLPEALNKGQYLIPRMTKDEVKEVITRPMELINATISDTLVEKLLNPIGNNQAQLPILQHTLMRVVDFWKNESNSQGPIDIEHYNAVGGLEKALSNHADEAYNELNSAENKLIAELIFKSLTDVGSNSKGIRRPCKLKDLAELLNVSENKIIEIIDVFRSPEKSFLLPQISKDITGDDLIDISHESLMREWDRLKFWSNEEAESGKIFLNLCGLAALYQEGKGSLLMNPELEVTMLWKERTKPNEKWGMRYDTSFVRGMTFLTQSKENHEFLILQKEIAQKNKIRRTKIFSIVISFAFILALGLSLASYVYYKDALKSKQSADTSAKKALESEKTAKKERDNAITQENKANISALAAKNAEIIAQQSDSTARLARDIAVIEKIKARESAKAEKIAAMAAYKSQKEAKESEVKARKAEKKAISASKEADSLKNIAESIKGAFLSLKSLDAKDYEKGIDLALKAHKKFTSNSKQKGNSDIYMALNRSLVEGGGLKPFQHAYGIKKVATNTKFKKTAFIDMKGDCFLNSDENMRYFHKVADMNLEDNVSCLSFSSTGEYLILGTNTGELKVLNTKSERALLNTQIFDNEIRSIRSATINSINYLLVLEGNKYHLIRLNNGEIKVEDSLELPFKNFKIDYVNASFSKIIIAKGSKAIMYSIALKKEEISILKTNEIDVLNKITSIEMSSNGNYLALGMNNGSIRLETLDKNMNSKNNEIINSHKSKVSDLKFIINKEESLLISSSYDNTLNIVNILETSDIIVLKGHKGWVHQLALSSDKRHLISVSEDRSLRKWFIYENDIVKLLNKN